jgi:NTP pyrophosphatase (non-canonical NTP hydrolase)
MFDIKKFTELNKNRAVEGFKTYENVSYSYWGNALAGEVGELCNMIKKIDRVKAGGIDGGSSYTAETLTDAMIMEEIGGIFIYLNLICSILGLNMEEAIVNTFNSKSKEYNFKQYIGSNVYTALSLDGLDNTLKEIVNLEKENKRLKEDRDNLFHKLQELDKS